MTGLFDGGDCARASTLPTELRPQLSMRLRRMPAGGKGRVLQAALGLLDTPSLPGDVLQLGSGSPEVALRQQETGWSSYKRETGGAWTRGQEKGEGLP